MVPSSPYVMTSCSSSADGGCWASGKSRNLAGGYSRCPNSPTTWISWVGVLARTRWAPGAAARAAAARVVEAVVTHGRSADAALADDGSTGERAAVRAIGLGTVRWYLRLWPALEGLMSRAAGADSTVPALLARRASHR